MDTVEEEALAEGLGEVAVVEVRYLLCLRVEGRSLKHCHKVDLVIGVAEAEAEVRPEAVEHQEEEPGGEEEREVVPKAEQRP